MSKTFTTSDARRALGIPELKSLLTEYTPPTNGQIVKPEMPPAAHRIPDKSGQPGTSLFKK